MVVAHIYGWGFVIRLRHSTNKHSAVAAAHNIKWDLLDASCIPLVGLSTKPWIGLNTL